MIGIEISAAQHAERILDAWQLANPDRFETELENALTSCKNQAPSSGLEYEQQELLTTVIENLRSMKVAHCVCLPQRLEADLALLQHLRGRRVHYS